MDFFYTPMAEWSKYIFLYCTDFIGCDWIMEKTI